MSLHTLANHLQSAGRAEDKVLVHMTPGEVNGLQSLAMAQGGSLTINPETGLPEAGILRSLLPMIAGFALGPAGFQLMSAAQAGLAVGAATGLATGSLKQGIMAGMGAYGGAGLGQGLMAQGAGAGAQGAAGAVDDIAAASAKSTANMQQGNVLGSIKPQPQVFGASNVTGATTPGGMTGYSANVPSVAPVHSGGISMPPAALQPRVDMPGVFTPGAAGGTAIPAPTPGPLTTVRGPDSLYAENISSYQTRLPQATPFNAPYNVAGPGTAPVVPPPIPTSTTSQQFAGGIQNQGGIPSNAVDVSGQSITRPFTDRMSQVGAGAKTSFSSMEGLKGLYDAMPTGSVIASGLTLAEAMKPEELKAQKDKSLIRPYDFDYGATGVSSQPYTGSGERLYFNPMFTARTPYEAPGREYAAAGGLMGYAAGGPVEQMANMNYVGMNTGYPMANLQTPMYSNPAMQTPEATNVIAPSADAGVGSYSGELRFARGGGTAEPESSGYTYDYNPTTMQFTQTGGPGAAAKPPSPEIATFDMMKRLNQAQITNTPYNFTPSWASGTTPNGQVSGGMAAPVMQPTNPTQPLIPNINVPAYQTPEQQLGLGGFYDYMNQQMRGYAGYAAGGNVGGISHLGGYSDGGRLLKGPGNGTSDSIPAMIGDKQPARLADGEFVIPSRIVSELGNGSTEAGARQLYAMMERIQKARRKTVGKNKVAVDAKARNELPA